MPLWSQEYIGLFLQALFDFDTFHTSTCPELSYLSSLREREDLASETVTYM